MFLGLNAKESYSDSQPFRRMLVKIKRQIIAFEMEDVDPDEGRKILPCTLKQWLDEGRNLTLLDIRNDYEVKLDTFKNAASKNVLETTTTERVSSSTRA